MNADPGAVLALFRSRFGGDPDVIACAPGRVNLIGEHTDYTGGLVLPAAIDRDILFAARAVPGNVIRGYSADFGEEAAVRVGEYDPAHPSRWLRYVLGVLREIAALRPPVALGAFEFCVLGTVPMGSGLSSSAALELAAATAAQALFGFRLGKTEAALLCQRAETGFVGVQCGIMDQFISSAGQRDHAILLDCRSLESQAVRAQIPGHTWLVIDSRKRRGLVDSEYNLRRAQCQAGLEYLREAVPGKRPSHFRDLDREDLEAARPGMDPVLYKRAKHVVTENARVEACCAALRAGDLAAVGRTLRASHASLRDDYEVSCAELDALVSIVEGVEGTVGARLTGAGFGGCAIALVADRAVAAVTDAVGKEYPARFPGQGDPVAVWPVRFSDGAKTLGAEAIAKGADNVGARKG